jgi:hypothetical protein
MDNHPVNVRLDNAEWSVEFIGKADDFVFFRIYEGFEKRSGLWNTVSEEGKYDPGEPINPVDRAVIRLAYVGWSARA